MGRAIFISYRRDDSEGEAGRLFDDLVRSFGEDSVFMDVSGINPGMDFRKAIDDNVASCGVLLAMIGPAWCSMRNNAGARRLDDPNDFVRLEIASALARNIAVIPVLVHDAKMPRPEELPDNLKDLAFRNSVEITHARWNSDVQLLTQALERYVSPGAPADTQPVHATVAVQLPPPTAPAGKAPSSRPTSVPLVMGVVAGVVIALGIVALILFRPHPVSPVPPNLAQTPAPAPVNSVDALVGTWTNPQPRQNNALDKLEISSAGAQQVSIHAWGRCGDSECDWGSQTATFDGAQAQANWQVASRAGGPVARTATIAIKPDTGGLKVTIANIFTDNRPPNHGQFKFVRAQ
jgi:hypothetical protein